MNGSQHQYVPWTVYMQDRRELREELAGLRRDVQALAVAVAKDDGREEQEQIVAEGVELSRRTHSERLWELTKTLFAAIVGGAVAITTAFLTGGWSP